MIGWFAHKRSFEVYVGRFEARYRWLKRATPRPASTTSDCEAVATPKTFKVVRIWLEGEDRFVSVEVDGQVVHLREGDEL